MSELRAAASRISQSRGWPVLPDRALKLEAVAQRLAERGHGFGTGRQLLPWVDFLRKLDLQNLERIVPQHFRRLLLEMWEYPADVSDKRSVLNQGVRATRKSFDRAILLSYLRHFPEGQDEFSYLEAASALVAGRHDWVWKTRGQRWNLWQRDAGLHEVANALMISDRPEEVLREAGLDGDLAEGRFVQASLERVLKIAALKQGREAEATGARLIALFDKLGTGKLNSLLAYALLVPWLRQSPSDGYRRKLMDLLVRRMDDPRFHSVKWMTFAKEVKTRLPNANVDPAFDILRRWLVQTTVREFFKIVGESIREPHARKQWRDREIFWISYLDAELINDAWFVFGLNARDAARSLLEEAKISYGLLSGAGSSQSVLVMSIGSLRIVEWSNDGACRFWISNDTTAPKLYEKNYQQTHLKAMSGGSGFDHIDHKGDWQRKFSDHIERITGIRAPANSGRRNG